MHRLVACLILALCSLVAPSAIAHPFGASALNLDIGQKRIVVKHELDSRTMADCLPDIDDDKDQALTQAELNAHRQRVVSYLDSKLTLTNDGKPCSPNEPSELEKTNNRRVRVLRDYICTAPLGTLNISNSIFMEDRGGHRHVGKFLVGDLAHHQVFIPDLLAIDIDASKAPIQPGGVIRADSESKPAAPAAKPAPKRAFLSWIWQGVVHVLGGLDHVLFVIVLLLAVERFRPLAIVVTAFTVAHSLTLAAAALGLVSLNARFAETLIALSIVYVAVDNIRSDSPKHRPQVAFGFGLLHGFGFSYVLRDLGLPTDGLPAALLGFNVGVEVGQLMIVAALFPLARYLAKQPKRYRKIVRGTSAAVCLLAAVWLLERAFDFKVLPI